MSVGVEFGADEPTGPLRNATQQQTDTYPPNRLTEYRADMRLFRADWKTNLALVSGDTGLWVLRGHFDAVNKYKCKRMFIVSHGHSSHCMSSIIL